MRTLSATGGATTDNATYVQVSRLGMPLTNEVINPIGGKDAWNRTTPYAEAAITDDYLSNPELGLYVADNAPVAPQRPSPPARPTSARPCRPWPRCASKPSRWRAARPAGHWLRLPQRRGRPVPAQRHGAVAGTALADAAFGNYLLVAGKPRSVDIKPIFHTGVPNLPPYQLATGKAGGNPLAAGKPFVNNFLPLTSARTPAAICCA